MGLLTGRKHKESHDEYAQRRARRRQTREAKRRQRLRAKLEKASKGKREPRNLDEFRDRCLAKDWDNAPMQFWYTFQAYHRQEMISWLNRNPKFVPPYGIYIGKAGEEPWRPELVCSVCTKRHQWPECERQ